MLQISFEERARRKRDLENKVAALYAEGMKRPRIAKALGIPLHIVDDLLLGVACNEDQRRAKHAAAIKNGKVLRHPWLDPMDDANIEGYWVPTPQELRDRAMMVRAAAITGDYSEVEADGAQLRCPRCDRKISAMRKGKCSACLKQDKLRRLARTAEHHRVSQQEASKQCRAS